MLRYPELAERQPDQRAMVMQWSRDLADLYPVELKRGIAASRDSRFAPNVGDFRRMCRPALDAEYAWVEAEGGVRARDRGERGVWSHPAVWRVAREFAYELRNSVFGQHRRRWEMLLAHEFAQGWGEDVPEAHARVGHQPKVVPMPEAIRAQMADLVTNWKTS